MLAGRAAFRNCETFPTRSPRILKGEPDWKALPSGIPAKIRARTRALPSKGRPPPHPRHRRCAHRNRRGPRRAGTSRRRGGAARCLTALGVPRVDARCRDVSAAALAFRALLPAAHDIRVVQFDVSGPEGSTVIAGQPLSPDGRKLAFAVRSDGTQRIWVWNPESSSAQSLPRTEGASRVFWSPDSQHIGFSAQGQLKRVSAAGGPPIVIGTVAGIDIWPLSGLVGAQKT